MTLASGGDGYTRVTDLYADVVACPIMSERHGHGLIHLACVRCESEPLARREHKEQDAMQGPWTTSPPWLVHSCVRVIHV